MLKLKLLEGLFTAPGTTEGRTSERVVNEAEHQQQQQEEQQNNAEKLLVEEDRKLRCTSDAASLNQICPGVINDDTNKLSSKNLLRRSLKWHQSI